MSKNKNTEKYDELKRTQDQLVVQNFMGLKDKQRAVTAEAQLIQVALEQNQPLAVAAEKRLAEWAKEQKPK